MGSYRETIRREVEKPLSNRDLTIIIPAHIKDAGKLAPCVNSLLENLYYVESEIDSTSFDSTIFDSTSTSSNAFAEGTRTNGGGSYLSAKRADFRLTPYGLLARDKKLKNLVSSRRLFR